MNVKGNSGIFVRGIRKINLFDEGLFTGSFFNCSFFQLPSVGGGKHSTERKRDHKKDRDDCTTVVVRCNAF